MGSSLCTNSSLTGNHNNLAIPSQDTLSHKVTSNQALHTVSSPDSPISNSMLLVVILRNSSHMVSSLTGSSHTVSQDIRSPRRSTHKQAQVVDMVMDTTVVALNGV